MNTPNQIAPTSEAATIPTSSDDDEFEEDCFEIIEYENSSTGAPPTPLLLPLEKHHFAYNGNVHKSGASGDTKTRLFRNTGPVINSTVKSELLELQEEEERLGKWPRRLLHIPTLHSYEWTPGNIYGGVKEPLYNAITYTWGRWRLPADDTSTDALPVLNIPWAVPKVRSDCFSVADFQNALENAGASHKDPTGLITYQAVEFVWLDVACISQDAFDRRSAAEVGRQALIFKGAQIAFIWLHSLNYNTLRSCCETIRAADGRHNDEQKAISTYQSILNLLKDPWFSSLWTLQEAFLRSDALLMSQEGSTVMVQLEVEARSGFHLSGEARKLIHYPGYTIETTMDLIAIIDSVVKLVDNDVSPRDAPQTNWFALTARRWRARAKEQLRKAGLLGLVSLNPLATYVAAERRTVSRREDQIYAIQQIFDLRLGSTAVRRDSAIHPVSEDNYSLSELQDQLGEHLLTKYPVLSQCHVYNTCTEVGRAWRVNETSVMISSSPSETTQSCSDSEMYPRAPSVWENNSEASKSLCRLDVYLLHEAVWGQFEGSMCSFSTFHRKCMEHEDDCIMTKHYKAHEANNFLDIWLDETKELDALDPRPHNFTPCSGQKRLADQLASRLSPHLYVLTLGMEFVQGAGPGEMLGLLMFRHLDASFQYWRRIGVCRWKLTHVTAYERDQRKRRTWFEGGGEGWQVTQGVFG